MKNNYFYFVIGLLILFTFQLPNLYAADTAYVSVNVFGPQNKAVNLQVGGAKPSLQLDSAREIPFSELKYILAFDSSGKVVAKMTMDSLKKKLAPPLETPQMFSSGYYSCSVSSNPQPFLSVYTDSSNLINISGSTLCLSSRNQSCQTRDMRIDWPNSGSFIFMQGGSSVVIIGTYIYVLIFQVDIPSFNNYIPRIYRYAKDNLALGGTLLTTMGLPLITTTGPFTMTSNGTNFYFSYNGGNSLSSNLIAKYSLSGTNLNYISSNTYGISTDFRQTFVVDNDEDLLTYTSIPSTKIRRFSISGILIKEYDSMVNYLMNYNNVLYGTNSSTFSTVPFLFYEKINK